MPEYAMWSLIVALIILALGLALKVAQLTHRLDDIKKKSASAESEFHSFQKQKDEEISDIKKLYDTRINELTKTISDLQPEVTIETNASHAAVLLDETKVNILKLLFSHDKLTTEQVSTSQHLQLQTAKYHLVDLANLGMVRSQNFSEQVPGLGPFHSAALRRYSAWIIMQPGRKFLIANGHVS
jgi:DNA-binding transcriptional ArsR family regulator